MAEKPTNLSVKSDTPPVPTRQGEWMPFESLRREVDRLFDDFHPFSWRAALPRGLGVLDRGIRRGQWPVAPAMDLVEKEKEYEITAELPGMDDKSVELKVSNNVLTIKGEKSEEKEEHKKDYYLSERRFGSFERSFQLPDGIDTDKIDATFAKGILTVKLPKTADAQKAEKTISVKPA